MVVPKEAVRRQISALIPVYMNVLMAGCSVGWLPNAIYFLLLGEEIHGTYSQCALVASFFDIGKTVFAIPSGLLVDKYGRKKITISVAILHFVAWLGISLNTSINMIYAGRFINGLASGLLDATSLMLVGEIASPEIRGRLAGIHNIFNVVGMVLPSIMSVILGSYRSLSLGVTLLSVISLLPMYRMTESPNYLLSVSKIEKAKKTLRLIRTGYEENQLQDEFEKLHSYIREEKADKSELSWLNFLKLKSVRKPLIIGMLSYFLTFITGGAALTGSYVTIIFPSNQYISARYYPLIGQIFGLILVSSTAFYVDKYPRRSIFLLGAAATTIVHAVCAFADYLVEDKNTPVFRWVFLPGNIIASAWFWTTLFPMTAALKSEIYPQAVKGFGSSLAVLSQALGSVIMFQSYVFFKVHSCLYLMYAIFSMCALMLFIEVYFLLPESGGVNLVDVQMKFKVKSTTSHRGDADIENNLLK